MSCLISVYSSDLIVHTKRSDYIYLYYMTCIWIPGNFEVQQSAPKPLLTCEQLRPKYVVLRK